jgi:hypothetical protein
VGRRPGSGAWLGCARSCGAIRAVCRRTYTLRAGRAAERVIRHSDEIIDISLRGKSLTSGSKKLRAAGLTERTTKTGRHEFVDDAGRVRAAWDPGNAKGGNHWHKFAEDGTPLNDAGRVVNRNEPKAHIRSP